MTVYGTLIYYSNGVVLKYLIIFLHDFVDYLHNRQQRVCIGGSSSSWKTIKAGFPEGLFLSLSLFNQYKRYSTGSNVRLLADDTSIYIIVDDLAVAVFQPNTDLQVIHNWLET